MKCKTHSSKSSYFCYKDKEWLCRVCALDHFKHADELISGTNYDIMYVLNDKVSLNKNIKRFKYKAPFSSKKSIDNKRIFQLVITFKFDLKKKNSRHLIFPLNKIKLEL